MINYTYLFLLASARYLLNLLHYYSGKRSPLPMVGCSNAVKYSLNSLISLWIYSPNSERARKQNKCDKPWGISVRICQIYYGWQENSPYLHNGGSWDIWCYIEPCFRNRKCANTNMAMFDVSLFCTCKIYCESVFLSVLWADLRPDYLIQF